MSKTWCKINHTVKSPVLILHFNSPLTPNAWCKSLEFEDGEDRVSTTELHVWSFISGFFKPRTSNVINAS